MCKTLFILLGLLSFAYAFPLYTTAEHIKLQPVGWSKLDDQTPSPDRQINIIIMMKLSNTHELENSLYRVSDPTNLQYGKHLSKKEIDQLTAPPALAVTTVIEWLRVSGIDFETSANKDMISIATTIAQAESLLRTTYHLYRHEVSGDVIARCESYQLPVVARKYIDFVGPTVRFPNPLSYPSLDITSNDYVTPDFLRKTYKVGNYIASSGNMAVASFLGQFYSPSDLQTFFSEFDKQAVGRTTNVYGPNNASVPGIEANLDIQYQMAMGNNVTSQFWSTPGSQPKSPENEPFLVWLYNVSALSDQEIPKVISVSYGDNENTVDFIYAQRVNAEFQKLGNRGVSVLFSSGDGGVAGGQPTECDAFIPTYPAGSPFVTAVGATHGSNPEVAASFSSGGISNYWARPDYQKDAVSNYFATAQGLPPASKYNQTGAGIPDVSAQGVDFMVVVSGMPLPVSGTSCSSPAFSGIVALLNDLRAQDGKPSLGFLNPLFYQNPDVFNDITSGSNPGCNTNGFPAAKGWDPVTGLGTPDFEKLSSLVKKI